MHSLRMMLMSGVATISLAVAPAVAQETAPAQGETPRSYDETYGGDFAAWGDRTVDELLGTEVVSQTGESVGQIDDIGLAGDQLVAIVGVGGFLGLGTHDVAIPIDAFTAEGDRLLLSGMTREELEALPEYDEGDSQLFAGNQTLRSGYEGSEVEMQQDDIAAGEPMQEVDEEVAQAADEETDVTGDAASQEMAESPDEAVEPMTEGEGAELAEGESTEPMAEEAEMAETEPTEQPAGEGAEMAEGDTAEQPATGEATEMAEGDTAEQPAAGEGAEMAEGDTAEQPAAGEATEMAEGEVTGESTTGATTEMAETEAESGWTEDMDRIFADIADREIAELIGMDVAGADGDVVGQIDNFALEGEDVVAIIGVGGFLGIGEHDVALPLGEMTYDGERMVLSSMTEDQLRELPEYESDETNRLPQDGTLRSTYNQ